MESQYHKLIRLAQVSPLIRDVTLREAGISSTVISQAVRAGDLVRLSRGVYQRPDADVDEHVSLSEVIARVPMAVVTLISALQFHEIGTQQAHAVWILLRQNAVRPRVNYPRIEVVRSRVDAAFTVGVHEYELNGIMVQVTNPARTVVDCFKYRNRVGLDVCLEALKDVLKREVRAQDIMDYAKIQRVTSVIRPYVDALV